MQGQSEDVVLHIAAAIFLFDYEYLVERVRVIVVGLQLAQNGDHHAVIEGRLSVHLGDYVLDRLEAEAHDLLDYLRFAHQLLSFEGHQRFGVLQARQGRDERERLEEVKQRE